MLRLAVTGLARWQPAAGCPAWALAQLHAAAAPPAPAARARPLHEQLQLQQRGGLWLLSARSPWLLSSSSSSAGLPQLLLAQQAQRCFAGQPPPPEQQQPPPPEQQQPLPPQQQAQQHQQLEQQPEQPQREQSLRDAQPEAQHPDASSGSSGSSGGNGQRYSSGASAVQQQDRLRYSAATAAQLQAQQDAPPPQQDAAQQPQPKVELAHHRAAHQAQPATAAYKIVQYSRGNSTMLSVAGDAASGDYSLAKSKGPASAADLAAFGRRRGKGSSGGSGAQQQHTGPPSGPAANVSLLAWQLQRLQKQLQATFLPAGYPTSVGSNYLQYTLWQAVTNFATTANGVLASTFLLYSVGIGAGAIPTAGALNWVLKDGLGQMGTLLFGKAIAHNFDIHSKTWYFMSFLLLSTATGLEIATILVPQAFLVLGSCANMIKGLSWMAGGSTRSVFNLSFVRDNNIADITAKNTSQYIFASLFGTAAGVSCCAYIGQSAPLALLCFSGLAYTSLYSAYRTVKAIPLPTLNSTRLQLLAAKYLKCVRASATGLDGFRGFMSYQQQHSFMSYQQEYEVPEEEDDTCELQLPSPLEMAELDNPLPWLMGDPRILNPGIHVGSQLDRLVEGQPALLVVLLNTFRYSRYLLVPERNAIHCVLHADAQPRDMVQAYLQACILRKCLKMGHLLSADNLPELRIVLHDTLLAAENLTPPFMRALARQGWQTEKIVVEAHRRRARW